MHVNVYSTQDYLLAGVCLCVYLDALNACLDPQLLHQFPGLCYVISRRHSGPSVITPLRQKPAYTTHVTFCYSNWTEQSADLLMKWYFNRGCLLFAVGNAHFNTIHFKLKPLWLLNY